MFQVFTLHDQGATSKDGRLKIGQILVFVDDVTWFSLLDMLHRIFLTLAADLTQFGEVVAIAVAPIHLDRLFLVGVGVEEIDGHIDAQLLGTFETQVDKRGREHVLFG